MNIKEAKEQVKNALVAYFTNAYLATDISISRS